jgi:hypothetical protein
MPRIIPGLAAVIMMAAAMLRHTDTGDQKVQRREGCKEQKLAHGELSVTQELVGQAMARLCDPKGAEAQNRI